MTKTIMEISSRIICCLLLISSNVVDAGEQPDSVGFVQAHMILTHYSEFNDNYHEYQPDTIALQQMEKLAGKDLVVMFGTWCHDSEREIPKLLKLLDSSEVPLNSLTLLAVDRNKQEPSGKAEKWQLKYTPTIVLLEGDKELGRIVERPRVSLSADLINMLD